MAQNTRSTYRILTGRQRPRRGWLTIRLTPRHLVALDPAVYSNAMFPPHPVLRERPDVFEVVSTKVGELGLCRAAS